jgi:hypothetical protein
MKKRLVIAHYNEDLSWLDKVNKDVEIVIYHKNHDKELKYNEQIKINDNEFLLPNVGRESHTYLKHMINYHNNYCDIEFFSQGFPEEYDIVKLVNSDNVAEYKQYTTFYRNFESMNGFITKHMRDDGYPDTRGIWDSLFTYDPPNFTEIVPHAYIKCDRNTLMFHNKDVYEKCLSFFKDNDPKNLYGWSFEYFWALLFNKIHKNKK